jgi:hypothetical protein
MKFLLIDGNLLVNKSLTPADKMIISYVNNLACSGKCFYGTYAFLCDQLGIRYDYLEKRLNALLEVGILVSSKEGITLKLPFWEICQNEFKIPK